MSDPFATIPAADPAEIVTRKPFVTVAKPTVGLFDDSSKKKKRVDLTGPQKRWVAAQGMTCERVDHTNAFGARTVDFLGFADFLAMGEGVLLLIQTTTLDHVSHRLKKAQSLTTLRDWLAGGGRFEVHGWRKERARWQVRRVRVELVDGELVRREVSE